ncbi:MAG: ABC transporter substrate-binding protein [Eubacteriaceae bacterium]|nr:ABC transporter substrate-binding protein [Eubacteriaceae bacterium]
MKKRKASAITILLIIVALAASCAKPQSQTQTPSERESTYMRVEHTSSFSVEYLEDGAKLVIDAEGQEFLLVPRGNEPPEGHGSATLLFTPVERAVFFSITQVGMVAHYEGLMDYVGGVTSDAGTWGNVANIEQALASGKVKYIGSANTPDYELIQEINPEVAFVYTGPSGQTDVINMLTQLGIPVAVDNEYMEESHEGRMEWTKFLASFFGYEEEALSYVDEQAGRLAQMEALVAGKEKPKVVWAMVYNGVVYSPGTDSFVARQVRAAGGEYLYFEGASSSQISLEEFYTILADADIWMYSSNKNYVPSYKALAEMAPIVEDAQVLFSLKRPGRVCKPGSASLSQYAPSVPWAASRDWFHLEKPQLKAL